jgi:endonuclease G, mitochondrial
MLTTVKKVLFVLLISAFGVSSCQKEKVICPGTGGTTAGLSKEDATNDPQQYETQAYANWPETFESGSKTAYTAGLVTLTTGAWNLNDALIGTSTSDRKVGTKSIRVQNVGTVEMNFNLTNGATAVSIKHGKYGTDANSSWALAYSTNSGSTWTNLGSTITTSTTTLATANFSINVTGNIRFRISKLSGGRLNIDDFSVVDQGGTTGGGTTGGSATRDNHLEMGNPSGATAVATNLSNYLLSKPQYIMSYNNGRGTPNWVAWHLSSAWKGTATRCDCFASEALLPSGFYKVTSTAYTSTGFDRGHLCPSDDRDGSATDNAATFTMSNMVPQAPANNQGLWANLEAYCRTLITAGNELYIISGAYGSGGTGSNGGTTTTINNGRVTVPSRLWKIVVVLPIGTGDASRVTSSTRIIAINVPNTQTSNNSAWGAYRTSVDAIESATGYDFLSAVPAAIQTAIEATTDAGPTQ